MAADNSKNVHVVPNRSNGTLDWSIKRPGASRSSGNFSNKSDALISARNMAKASKSELFEHGKNGQIQNRNTYGTDPYPPKG